jgi:hypothetical protein
MARVRTYAHAFNVGVHDSTALARVDLERMRLAAEVQTNMLPFATGQGVMRPGLQYLGTTDASAVARVKEFVFGATDAALMEFSNQSLRVWNSDALITRVSVATAVTNGDFSSDTGWTLTATTGGTATISGGKLTLAAVGRGAKPTCVRSVTVDAGDQAKVHAVRIIVDRGPVNFKLGTTSGGEELIATTSLDTGTHSLSFTPGSGTIYPWFGTTTQQTKIVDSITVEAAGIMSLPTPWPTAAFDLMRFAQSADVVFVACRGYSPYRIERRSMTSWSVVQYKPNDGPYILPGVTALNTLATVAATNGANTTITTDAPFFKSTHVGALIKVDAPTQEFRTDLSGEEQYSESMRVFAVGVSKDFTVTRAGTWAGTLSLQVSLDGPDIGFRDFGSTTYNTNGTATVSLGDAYNNVATWVRVGFKSGAYTSGTAEITLSWDGSSGSGVGRITAFNSSTSVAVEVLKNFRSTKASPSWRIGEWSAANIWPSAVSLYDGRLWWSGFDRIWGSVSDDFTNFDEDFEGDAGPISRSIATGGINETQWLLGLQRLIIGTEGAVAVAKASSLDEPLTPTGFTIRDASSVGVGAVDPAKLDGRGLAVERAGRAIMEIVFDASQSDYRVTQLSKLTTELFISGVRSIAVQRRPETRVWIVCNDGTCVVCVYEPDQEVIAFVPIETDGEFESAAVLPADAQDRVYFVVKRTVNNATVRYLEKMALDDEVKPGNLCRVMDSFTTGTASATATIPVGVHLIGETVVAWVNGAPMETATGVRGTYVVDGSGNITLAAPVTGNWVAGLPYRMRYKSARLAYGAEGGTAMLARKEVNTIGAIMTGFTRQGVKHGMSFDKMYRLPEKGSGKTLSNIVTDVEDIVPFSAGGGWSLDSRVHLEVNSPYTATFCGVVLDITTSG